jgi:ABC-2 type transport system ATP-binding protein
VVFLDEPTAGVDLHNRALFWELIQEEAEAGVTVFVTTHFLEEADYCDWVSFIDRGKLIADTTPEGLRRQFSDGYRIEIEAGAEDRGRVADHLGAAGRLLETTERGLRLRAEALDDELMGRLERLAEELPGARIEIVQPSMTEVFRRVVTEAGP